MKLTKEMCRYAILCAPVTARILLVLLAVLACDVARAQSGSGGDVAAATPRFTADSSVKWEVTANPNRYFDAIGRRAAVFGKQNGKFEAWIWPMKLLHGFRLEFQPDNTPEPVRGEDYLQTVTVRPESTTLLYVHPSFTVKQIIWVPHDQPAIVQFFDVTSDRPLTITAKFVPDFRPMWPAAMGGQHTGWLDDEKAFTVSDGTNQPTGIVGTPTASAFTQFMDHSLIGGEMLLRIATNPEQSRHMLYPLVMTLNMDGEEQARSLYRQILGHAKELYEQNVRDWRDFMASTMQLHTPDEDLNRAFLWAKISMEQGWSCNAPATSQATGKPAPSVPREGFAFPADEPCGIVAGYGPAGEGERPGFAWWFGGDGLMATWALEDYGDVDGALRELRFLRAHQRADGKMMHELPQSAGLLDWFGKYHFGYMHADTTPMYLYSLGQYWERTGDRKFLDEFWPSARKAYEYCVSTLDPKDGLMDNTKSGLGAIEVGVLKGKVTKDVYVQGFWVGALRTMVWMADAAGDKQLSADARARLQKATESLWRQWRDPRLKYFAFGLNAEGQRAEMMGTWSAVLLSLGGGTGHGSDDADAAKTFALPELATDWGSRWISDHSPIYDPLSYNNGTAWPFSSGFVAWAQYANDQPLAGYSTLMSLARLAGVQAPGGMPEHMAGNRNEPGERSVPHQLFSSWSMLRPVVAGMLGLQATVPDVSAEADGPTLHFAPSLPVNWPTVEFRGFRVGRTKFNGKLSQSMDRIILELSAEGKPAPVVFAPAIPYAASIGRVTVNGRPVKFERVAAAVPRVSLRLSANDLQQPARIVIEHSGGIGIIPIKPTPERGDPNTSLKIIDITHGTNAAHPSLALKLAGLGGRTYDLDLMTARSNLSAEGASLDKTTNGYRLKVAFDSAEDYVVKTVVVRY